MQNRYKTMRTKAVASKSLGSDARVFATLRESNINIQMIVESTETFDSENLSSPPAKHHHRQNALTSEEITKLLRNLNTLQQKNSHNYKPPMRNRRCETWDDQKFVDVKDTFSPLMDKRTTIDSALSGWGQCRNRRCDAWDDINFEEHFGKQPSIAAQPIFIGYQ